MLVGLPMMFAFFTVIDMTFALPGRGFVSKENAVVWCEALAPQYKSYSPPRCSRFGSKETNPQGYAIAIGACVVMGSFLWFSSRPGRGLRLSR